MEQRYISIKYLEILPILKLFPTSYDLYLHHKKSSGIKLSNDAKHVAKYLQIQMYNFAINLKIIYRSPTASTIKKDCKRFV